jgi:hypothetical protein
MMVMLGAGLTEQEALWLDADMREYIQAIGIYDDIQVPPEVTGPNAFGKATLAQVIPSDRRVYRQFVFPASNEVPDDSYKFFPITDAVARSHTFTNHNVFLPTDPIATTVGSNIITITDTAHGCHSDGDVVAIGGVVGPAGTPTAINGIPITEINSKFMIQSIVDDNRYTVQVTTPATADGTGGGANATVAAVRFGLNVSTFTPERNGVFWGFIWSSRGERDGNDDTGPITSGIVKPNDCNPTFKRETGSFVGIQCRPAFKLKKRATGELLVKTAHSVGYLPRSEPSDPFGWGYLDYAEQYDIDPR